MGNRFSRFSRSFSEKIIRFRWVVILVSIAVVAAGSYGSRYRTYSDSYRIWFDESNPDLKAFDVLQNTYTKADNILFVVEAKDGNIFSKEHLAAIEWLTQQSWKMPYSTRVDSITNFQNTSANGDQLVVKDLAKNSESLSAAELAKIRETALNDPLIVKNLVSEKGHVGAVNIMITLPGKDPMETAESAGFAKNLKNEFQEKYPNTNIYLTGFMMMNYSLPEFAGQDMATLIPLMNIILIVALAILLRSFMGVLTSLVLVWMTLSVSNGIAGWFGFPITSISAIAPTIIMTLAIADCVHLLVTFLKLVRQGVERKEAITQSLSLHLFPITVTSLTNFIGYASMNFSESPPFRQFGNTVAVGAAALFLLAIFFFPALIAVLPGWGKKRVEVDSDQPSLGRWESRIAEFTIRHRYKLVGGMTVLCAVFTALAFTNELNEEWVKYFAKRTSIRQDSDFTAANLTGIYDIQYALESGAPGGVNEPEYLRTVEKFNEWYRSQPEVISTMAITDIVKRINRSMHGDDESFYRVPERNDLAAQYLLLYELSLPYGMDLTTFVKGDKSATRMLVRTRNLTTQELVRLDKRAQGWLHANAPRAMAEAGIGGSQSVMFAKIANRMIDGMVKGSIFSLVLTSLLLIGIFRSLRLGLVSLIPNLVPIGLAMGIWALAIGQIGMTIALTISTTLGVIVDDTIHFVGQYLRARRREDMEPEEAMREAFKHTGLAIGFTTIVLFLGFLVLALSPVELNRDMGLITALTVLIAAGVELLFTAPLILVVEEIFMKSKPNSFLGFLARLEEDGLRTSVRDNRQVVNKSLALLVAIGLLVSGTAIADNRGLKIAQEVEKHRAGFHDYTAELVMTLKGSDKKPIGQSWLKINIIETKGDGDKILVVFDRPGDVKGTALLTHAHRTSSDDQWLFLPSVKRTKRVSATNKSGPFMGSEFAFEDMSYEPLERFTYKFVEEKKCDFGNCFLVERKPVSSDSGYTKQVIWVDTKEYRIVKIDYYDRKASHLKTVTMSSFKKSLGRFWRPLAMEMVNHQTGKSTVLQWSNLRYRMGLTHRDFETQSLERNF